MNRMFDGTGVALITPFSDNGDVDFASLKKLIQHVSPHVDYLVVNGTTGESATTTTEEKTAILDLVIKENSGKLPVVFGIGGNNTKDIISKIKEHDLTGVSALLSVSPYYVRPNQEGIYQHYKAIAESSPVPVILYNVPSRTGSNIHAQTTLRLAEIENIIGIKEASGDIIQAIEITKCKREDFALISGDDLLTLPLISIGAVGIISVLANAFPEQFSTMVKKSLACKNEEAAAILRKFVTINPCIYEEGNPVGIKLVLEEMGICSANVRLPLTKGSPKLKDKIKSCLREIF